MTQPTRRKLRCAVIGTGSFAEVCHIPQLQAHPHAEVVAICGGEDRARRLADSFGIPDIYTDVGNLCSRDDIDAVSIVTRNADHKHQALAALHSGKHVLCEKPLATSPADAREMVDAADASGRINHVAFVFRYNYGVRELRRRVQRGDIGQPFLCRVQYDNWDGLKPDWKLGWIDLKDQAGAGVLFHLGSHLFDMARFVLGPIEAVTGFSHVVPRSAEHVLTAVRTPVETDDLFYSWVRHRNGVRGQLAVSRVTPSFTRNGQFEVIGPEGALRAPLSRGAWDALQISTPTAPEWTDVPLPDAAYDKQPHCLELMVHSFVDACLRGRSDPEVDATFSDGLAAQRAMAAVLERDGDGRWTQLGDS